MTAITAPTTGHMPPDEEHLNALDAGAEQLALVLVVHANTKAITVDYDPIEHLNAVFSHPSTLSSVSQISDALHQCEDELDDDIATLVEEQVTSNADSVERIQAAK